ncbi:helix-turn-helix domain-containing protein [Streptomyces erythrochromogenes]|uniref:helix-turn-helix domain-containing protein n=1 Tax=Streptomyces erythrochromogenes TaxID=285574 RepID=UPI0036773E3A
MPTSPSSSAQSARKAVADRLREIRQDAGLSAKAVADRTGWYKSKVSRLENAVTPPSDDDVRAWCRACEADGMAADLIAASRSAENMYVDWRRLQKTGLRRLQESYVPLFDRTKTFRVYCSNVVPGLCQTDSYARALLGSIAAFRAAPDDVSDAVAARVARARVLREGPHRFAFLLEEAVLRHRVGSTATMTAQLEHLVSIMSLPSVSIGVVPFTAPRRMWMLETFSIYDEEQAQVETLTAQINVTAPTEVRQYLDAFGEFKKLAVFGAKARTLIEAASRTLE